MRTTILTPIALAIVTLASSSSAGAGDWLTMPSQFTHDPATGIRVSQYAPPPSPTAPMAADFRTSGFSHTRSTLNYGQSADNYYRVKTWGAPVQPYGEWRFPNRPYSAPYSQWGAPYAGLGQNNIGIYGGNGGYGGYGGSSGYGGFGQGNFGGQLGAPSNLLNPYSIGPNSAYPDPPYYDGYHPVYRD